MPGNFIFWEFKKGDDGKFSFCSREGSSRFCFISKLAEGVVVEGSIEAFNSGRTLLLSIDSVFLQGKQSSSSYALGAFGGMSVLVQIDGFMLSQHSQAAKE